MRMPSKRQLKSLEKATQIYEGKLALAMGYLTDRGITKETALEARLGVVESPEPGHEHAQGRLAIPYTNKLGVIGFKFRCIVGHDCKAEGCPKYIIPNGQDEYLYGVVDADDDADTLHVTEGELDRLVLRQVLGEPTVGLPGASVWAPHHPWHFKAWARVLGWADGDKAGTDMNKRLLKAISNYEFVAMPSGHDVNSLFLELGAEAVKRLAGLEDEE
jgi:DNA primase